MVALDQAVAVAAVEGPDVALRLADALPLPQYWYWHGTRAELLRRLGPTEEAREADLRALQLTSDPAERRLLRRRLEGT